MKAARWTAAAFTLLMGVMNVPVVVDDGGTDLPMALRVVTSLAGLAGIVAAVALARRVPWATPAVILLGALNVAGAVWALSENSEGAAIGLIVSLLGLGIGVLTRVTEDGARAPSFT